MTDKNYVHILAIVDRSGSMSTIKKDMIGGLDAFFQSQAKLDGTCLVDYVQFDTTYEKPFEDTPVAEAKAVLQPRGGTALLDAIGRGVTELGEKLAAKSEGQRPGLVQVIVVTDGYENSSREWSAAKVKELITQQEGEYNWDFIFLGANMDAVAVGDLYGFNPNKSITYDTRNVNAMAAAVSTYTTRSRLGDAASNTFTDDEREAQKA